MPTDKRYSVVLIFGFPGSGKGTQGTVLGHMPNMIHLAMGDIFRALDKGSDMGKEFLTYSTKGLLVPDEFTVRLWHNHVEGLRAEGAYDPDYHVLLLDGIPRTTTQVTLLQDLIEVQKILYLVIENDEALIARLSARAKKSNRPDDADPDVIHKRIDVYKQSTSPVLEVYGSKLIADINADQHPLLVLRDISGVLSEVISGAV